MILFVYMEQYILFIKENIMYQDSIRMFNYKIKFKFNLEIYIKIVRCKIVKSQEFMQRNKKVLVLHYIIEKPIKKFVYYIADMAAMIQSHFE